MQFRTAFRRPTTCGVILTALSLLVGSGCGGGSSDSADAAKKETSSFAKSEKSSGSTSKSGGNESGGAESGGQRSIDGIPLDVFFDRPLEVASDQRTGGTAPAIAATTPDATNAAPTKPAGAPPAESKSDDVSWSDLITAEALNEEARFLRNEMQSRLTNMGSYKKAVLELPVFGSAIAFVAEIAARHNGDISWKDNAKYIRVLGAKIAEITSSSTAQSRNSYDEVNNAYLTINEILNNNTPAELPEAEDESGDFSEFADMFYLMKRMERGQQWMQTNAGSESGFNDKAPTLARELAMMVILTQAYYSEGYGYSDDEEFRGYLNKLRDAGVGMQKALEEKDFAKYDELRSVAGQQCTQCHSVFKNG